MVDPPSDHPLLREVHRRHEAEPDTLWVYAADASAGVGIWIPEYDAWPEIVARVADAIQELIIESDTYWGTAIPPCPLHPNTPLWPNVVAGRAVWSCGTSGQPPMIPIGELPGASDHGGAG